MASPTVRRASRRNSAAATAAAVMDAPDPAAVIDSQADRFERFRSEVEFFDVLQKLTPAEWERFILYIYRLEPKIRNASGPQYIEKLTQPIDMQYLKDTHGGGVYQLWLKFPEDLDGYVRKHIVTIVGTPKYSPGQTIVGETQPASAAPLAVVAPAAVPVMDENAIASIVRTVVTAMQQNQSPDVAAAAMKSAMEIMAQGSKAALEQVVTHNKSQNGSTTGNPLLDKLLESAIAKMTSPEPARSLTDQLKDLASVRDLFAPEEKEEGSGIMAQFTDLKNSLVAAIGTKGKADITTALLGQAPQILSSVKEALAAWREVELSKLHVQRINAETRYLHLQRGGSLSELVAAAQVGQVAPPIGAPTFTPAPQSGPTNGTVPAGATAVTSAPLPSNFTAAAPELEPVSPEGAEDIMGKVLQLIADQFMAGTPGGGTVELVRNYFPGVIDQVAPMLSSKAQVLEFARSNPILQAVVDEEGFEEFADELVNEILGRPGHA